MRAAFFTLLAALAFGVLSLIAEVNIAWRRLTHRNPPNTD